MKKQIKDGGPAFPRDSFRDKQLGLIVQQNGMTLRDWFAGQVLAATDPTEHTAQVLAQWAYETADAMLTAREGRVES